MMSSMMKFILSSLKLGALFGCLLAPVFSVMATNADTHNSTEISDTHKNDNTESQEVLSDNLTKKSDTHENSLQDSPTATAKSPAKVLERPAVLQDKGPAAISAQKQAEIDKLVGKKREQAVASEDKKVLQDKALNNQRKLDQGTIDAQIEDVLGSQEFIELEKSEVFSKSRNNTNKNKKKESEPEATLLQLDQSDLMDYVAEDDFWKEQLTIEDEPG